MEFATEYPGQTSGERSRRGYISPANVTHARCTTEEIITAVRLTEEVGFEAVCLNKTCPIEINANWPEYQKTFKELNKRWVQGQDVIRKAQ